MERFEIGMLAKSKAGHDKDHTYVIYNADESYVYLVDGILKTVDNPKKEEVETRTDYKTKFDVSAADDVAIKRILKMYTHRA